MQRLPPWLFPGLPKAGTKRGSAGPGLLQGRELRVLGLHMTGVRTRTPSAAGGRAEEPGVGAASPAGWAPRLWPACLYRPSVLAPRGTGPKSPGAWAGLA